MYFIEYHNIILYFFNKCCIYVFYGGSKRNRLSIVAQTAMGGVYEAVFGYIAAVELAVHAHRYRFLSVLDVFVFGESGE